MDTGTVVVARQPIFDAGWEVIAYELLYRPVAEGSDPIAPEAMTAGVVATAFSDLGLDLLVGDRTAHINVTREFLLGVRPLPLEPHRTVIELVEDQVVDNALIEVLAEAVDAGFTLALDDFVYAPKMERLLDLASIVKLDVRALSPAQLAAEVRKLLRYANSAYVAPLRPIASLRHALTMIGATAIRRWGLLLALSGLRDAPHHLLNAAMIRARMSEIVAPAMSAAPDRAFTAGLF